MVFWKAGKYLLNGGKLSISFNFLRDEEERVFREVVAHIQ